MLIQNRKILKTQVKELNIIFKKKITEQNDHFFHPHSFITDLGWCLVKHSFLSNLKMPLS
jgi:hypothetical protein